MPVSEEPKKRSYDETVKRTGADYVKFTDKYRTVIRLLEPQARTVWKHFINAANGGRGGGAVCPNVTPGLNICPIEAQYADRPRDDEERKANNARRKFIINVLDRTPHTTCKACNTLTPGAATASQRGKFCVNCGADLKGHDFSPLNKVKVLEQGPNLFNKQLNTLEQYQLDEIGKPITDYDITITAQGEGRDRVLTAMPQEPKEISEEELIDPETGEKQPLWDLDLLAAPESAEVITLMLQGATTDQINAVKGVE